MRGDSGLNTGLTAYGELPFQAWTPTLVQARSNEVRATVNCLLLYQRSSTFTYYATMLNVHGHVNCSNVCSCVHTLIQSIIRPCLDVFLPAPVLAGGQGGGRTAVRSRDEGTGRLSVQGWFRPCSGEGKEDEERLRSWGIGRSITFVGTRCLSNVKYFFVQYVIN